MQMRITLLGPTKSGKTKIIGRLKGISSFDETYQETQVWESIQLPISLTDSTKSMGCPIWDSAGSEKYNSLHNIYLRDTNILCYCIDLTAKIDPQKIQKVIADARDIIHPKQNLKIILIGTKADHPDAKQEELNKLELQGFKIYQRIITSAKQDTALVVQNNIALSAENKTMSIKELFQNFLQEIIEKNTSYAAPSSEIPVTNTETITTTEKFPPSYDKIWSTVNDNTLATLALLKDYSKIEKGTGFFETLKSTARLIVSCHLLRSHHKAVAATLVESSVTTPPETILKTLAKKLEEKGDSINVEGSLAKRIRFIQHQLNLSVINIDDLNDTINENKTPGCCF